MSRKKWRNPKPMKRKKALQAEFLNEVREKVWENTVGKFLPRGYFKDMTESDIVAATVSGYFAEKRMREGHL